MVVAGTSFNGMSYAKLIVNSEYEKERLRTDMELRRAGSFVMESLKKLDFPHFSIKCVA